MWIQFTFLFPFLKTVSSFNDSEPIIWDSESVESAGLWAIFWSGNFGSRVQIEGKLSKKEANYFKLSHWHIGSSGGWKERTKLREKVTLKFISFTLPIVPTYVTIKLRKKVPYQTFITKRPSWFEHSNSCLKHFTKRKT